MSIKVEASPQKNVMWHPTQDFVRVELGTNGQKNCDSNGHTSLAAINIDSDSFSPVPEEKRARFRDIFLKSDIHGLPEWYQAEKRSTRVCWTIILFLAVAFMIYELVICSLDFKNNPILTTYSVVSQPRGMPFPDLYFCPLSPIHDGVRTHSHISKKWEAEKNVSEFFLASSEIFGADSNSGILRRKLTAWEQYGAHLLPKVLSSSPFFTLSGRDAKIPPIWIPSDIQEYFMGVGYKTETLFQV